MNPPEKHCIIESCDAYPPFGFQPVKSVPARWACGKHQSQLYRDTEAPKPLAGGDLFNRSRTAS